MSSDSSLDAYLRCEKKRAKKTSKKVAKTNRKKKRKSQTAGLQDYAVHSKKVCRGKVTAGKHDGIYLKGLRSTFVGREGLSDENVARRDEDLARLIDFGGGIVPTDGPLAQNLNTNLCELDEQHSPRDPLIPIKTDTGQNQLVMMEKADDDGQLRQAGRQNRIVARYSQLEVLTRIKRNGRHEESAGRGLAVQSRREGRSDRSSVREHHEDGRSSRSIKVHRRNHDVGSDSSRDVQQHAVPGKKESREFLDNMYSAGMDVEKRFSRDSRLRGRSISLHRRSERETGVRGSNEGVVEAARRRARGKSSGGSPDEVHSHSDDARRRVSREKKRSEENDRRGFDIHRMFKNVKLTEDAARSAGDGVMVEDHAKMRKSSKGGRSGDPRSDYQKRRASSSQAVLASDDLDAFRQRSSRSCKEHSRKTRHRLASEEDLFSQFEPLVENYEPLKNAVNEVARDSRLVARGLGDQGERKRGSAHGNDENVDLDPCSPPTKRWTGPGDLRNGNDAFQPPSVPYLRVRSTSTAKTASCTSISLAKSDAAASSMGVIESFLQPPKPPMLSGCSGFCPEFSSTPMPNVVEGIAATQAPALEDCYIQFADKMDATLASAAVQEIEEPADDRVMLCQYFMKRLRLLDGDGSDSNANQQQSPRVQETTAEAIRASNSTIMPPSFGRNSPRHLSAMELIESSAPAQEEVPLEHVGVSENSSEPLECLEIVPEDFEGPPSESSPTSHRILRSILNHGLGLTLHTPVHVFNRRRMY